jgi:hypothetical protein
MGTAHTRLTGEQVGEGVDSDFVDGCVDRQLVRSVCVCGELGLPTLLLLTLEGAKLCQGCH